MKQLQTEDASWNGLKDIVILETWGFFWLISGTTLFMLPFGFYFEPTQFFLVKGKEKLCFTI